MTATVSNKPMKTVNPPLHNFRYNVRGDLKLMIVMFILHMFAAPAVMLSMIIGVYADKTDTVEVYVIIGCIATAIAGFLGIFPAVNSFSCLHSKALVDMKLSVPMTARQRFVSNFLSGLFTYLAPFLSAQVISVLLTCYGLLFMEGRTFTHIVRGWNSVTQNYTYQSIPYVCSVFGQAAPMLFKLILCGVLAMFMVYATAVLVTMCCGSKFESIVYTIIINALIPMTEFCVFSEIYSNLYGISSEEALLKVIMYTSSLGGILAAENWTTKGSLLSYDSFNYGVWALMYFILTAAITALAYFLYGKRRAEQVSRPFVFKLLYYIIVTCIIFCITAIMLGSEGLIPTIMISFIAYMIFEVITNRGFKRFWLSIIKYAATFLGASMLIFIGIRTDGFGAATRVPSAASVVSAEVYYPGAYGFYSGLNYPALREYMPSKNSQTPVVLKDKENIKAVIEAHRSIVDDYIADRYFVGFIIDYRSSYADTYDYGSEYGYGISPKYNNMIMNEFRVRYKLVGGGSFTRTYYYQTSECAEALARIDCTEEYKSQIAEAYRKAISDIPAAYENEINDPLVSNNRRYIMSVKHWLVDSPGEIYDVYNVGSEVSIKALCARNFYEQLADAYCKDIMSITEENYYHSRYKNIWRADLTDDIESSHSVSIYIPESFENTVRVMKDYEISMKGVDDFSDREIYRMLAKAAGNSKVMVYGGNDMKFIDYISSKNNGLRRLSRTRGCCVYDFDEAVLKLFRSAMPMNIGDENGYIISIYGCSSAVPAEMYPAAAQINTEQYSEERARLYRDESYGFARGFAE